MIYVVCRSYSPVLISSSWLITGLLSGVIRQFSTVEQGLFALQSTCFNVVCVVFIFTLLCGALLMIVCLFLLFLLTIELSDLPITLLVN